jgi:NADH dehydrogenase/NADH:ubiquinone oxidoreductase subunit G
MIYITVDNRELEVEEGASLLQACLDNRIYIPSLCHIKEIEKPSASCRLCFVEIKGMPGPVTSCTIRVTQGLDVKTDTETVRALQRSALNLLLSAHQVDCANCPANKRCELQKIAAFLKTGLKVKHLGIKLKKPGIDSAHPCIDYYPNRCVLCGRCVEICKDRQGRPILNFSKRGIDTVISFYEETDPDGLPCGHCLACADICPVGALQFKNRDGR